MPRTQKKSVDEIVREYHSKNISPYRRATSITPNPITTADRRKNQLNEYHAYGMELFQSEHVKQDLVNRLNAGAKANSKMRLGHMPFTTYMKLFDQGKESVTYRTIPNRETGRVKTPCINYEFKGSENMPKLGGSGSWSVKVIKYDVDIGRGMIAAVYYRLSYTYMKFFFNMTTEKVDVSFRYTVQIFDWWRQEWESMAGFDT